MGGYEETYILPSNARDATDDQNILESPRKSKALMFPDKSSQQRSVTVL